MTKRSHETEGTTSSGPTKPAMPEMTILQTVPPETKVVDPPKHAGKAVPQLGVGGFEGRHLEGGPPTVFARMRGAGGAAKRETWMLSNGSHPQIPAWVPPGPGTQPAMLILASHGGGSGVPLLTGIAIPTLAAVGINGVTAAHFETYTMIESAFPPPPAGGAPLPSRLVGAGMYRVRDLTHPTDPTRPHAWVWYPAVPGNREIWLFRTPGPAGWMRPGSNHPLARWWIEFMQPDPGPIVDPQVAHDDFRVAVCADPVNDVSLSELTLEDYGIEDGEI